ncbi:DUF3592 domain-containing protein [Vibrio sp.]|uniref:DUF3592 domain-containing protein n=1 Tax=Vibrio sp. TaxID=678 RepID=UPI003AA8BB4A
MRYLSGAIVLSVWLLFSFVIFKLLIKNNRSKRDLKKHGIETQGEITDFYTQGGNGSSLTNIFITVHFVSEDGQMYEVRSHDVIKAEEQGKYRIGTHFKLTYQPDQPMNFILHIRNPIFKQRQN